MLVLLGYRKGNWNGRGGFRGTMGREIRGFGIIGEMDVTFQSVSGGFEGDGKVWR